MLCSDELIMNLRDPRILAVAAAQRRLLESDYDNYGGADAGGAAFCRSAALIVSTCNNFLVLLIVTRWD